MRALILPPACFALLCALALTACGGSSSDATPTPRPTQAAPTAAPRTTMPAATAGASPATTATASAPVTPGATVEVTGIVGTVSAATQTIEIRRLQGANVTRLEVGPRTSIRKATGGAAQLRDIRPSDRLVAEGVINDRGDTLLVTQITVQDILPGAQPGG